MENDALNGEVLGPVEFSLKMIRLTNIIRSTIFSALLAAGCSSPKRGNGTQDIIVDTLTATTDQEGLADFPQTEQDITVKDAAELPLADVDVTVYKLHKNGKYRGDIYTARTPRNEGGMNVYLHYNNQGAYLLTERNLHIHPSTGLISFDHEFKEMVFDLQRWVVGNEYSCDGIFTTAKLIEQRERTIKLISYIDPTGLVQGTYDNIEWLIEQGILQDLPPDKEWFALSPINPVTFPELMQQDLVRTVFSSVAYSQLERACGGEVIDAGTGGQDGGSLLSEKIIFASTRDGLRNPEIYVMNPDGSGQMNLTNSPGPDVQPSSCPGGSVLFAASREGNVDIYRMNADGGDVVRLTRVLAYDSEPSCSADGLRIAFTSNRDGNNEVYTMNRDGSDISRLTATPEEENHPSWCGNDLIAFVSNRDGNREIYTMRQDGSDVKRLTNNPATDLSPACSPDSRTIAFFSDRSGRNNIYLMNTAGNNLRRITDGNNDGDPAWSPEGQQLVFASGRDESNGNIYLMSASGRDVIRLTTSSAGDTFPSWSVRSR